MKKLIFLLFLLPSLIFSKEVTEKKYGSRSFNIIPVYINTGFSENGTKFELVFYPKKNQVLSTSVGLLLKDGNQFETSFSLRIHVDNSSSSSFIFSPTINYGMREHTLIKYREVDEYDNSPISQLAYKAINPYFSISTLAGFYIQLTQHINLSLLVGPSFLMKKKDVVWKENFYLTFAPSIGYRF